MKFSCTQENINHGLQLVSHIASKNVNLPILHNVLIEAKEDGVYMAATNLEMGMRVRIRGKVEETGSFTVPAHIFTNYVNLLTAERVDIFLEGNELFVSAGSQKTKIKGEKAEEFPLIPDVSGDGAIRIASQDCKEIMKQALMATSNDDSRPELTGVFFSVSGKELTVASTDSYRLVHAVKDLLEASSSPHSCIIPGTSISELIRVLPDDDTELKIVTSDSQVKFETEQFMLTSRLIEGAFPDYQQIIPKEEHTTVIVDRETLVKAIKASSLFSKSGIHDINMHFSPEKKEITLTTVNNQVGENVTNVQAEITGDENNTVMNFRYVLDGLSHIRSAKVRGSFVDSNTPGVFRAVDADQQSRDTFVYIVMPIKQ